MRARFAELNLVIKSVFREKDFFRLQPQKSKVYTYYWKPMADGWQPWSRNRQKIPVFNFRPIIPRENYVLE